MSNEELIRQLEDLKNRLPLSEYDQLLFQKQDQIKALQDKIANNDNYRTETEPVAPAATPTEAPTAEEWMYDAHSENGMEGPEAVETPETVNAPIRENEVIRKGFEVRKNRIAELTERNEELNIELAEAEQTLVDKRREFAQANNMSDNFDVNSPEIAGQQALTAMLEKQIEDIRASIAENEERISSDQAKLDDPNYGEAAFEALMAEDPNVNYQAKFGDQRELDNMISSYGEDLEYLTNENGYTQASLNAQIDNWMEQINSGTATPEAIAAEIGEVATRINLNSSVEEEREAELAEIDRQLAENSMELAEVQTRLDDRFNYVLSSIQGEAYNKKIANVQLGKDLAEARQQKADLDALYAEYAATTDENRKAELETQISEKRTEMGKIRNAHKDDVAKFDARIAALKEEQENVLTNEEFNRIQELREELSKLDKDKDAVRLLEIGTEINGILDKTTFDDNKMRLDQKREAELLSAKAALEARKEFLSVGVVERLLTIQQGLEKGLVNDAPVNNELADNKEQNDINDLMSGATPVESNINDLMAGATVVQPTSALTDEERKANLQKALENDNMRDSWLQRAENEDVYWKNPNEQTQEPDNKDNKFKVAGFAAAGAALLNKAKGMLDKAKAKLAGVRDHFAKHWKKYAAVALLVLLASCGKQAVDKGISEDAVAEQDLENLDIDEATVDQTTSEEDLDQEKDAEENEKEDEDNKTNNNSNKPSNNNNNNNNNINNTQPTVPVQPVIPNNITPSLNSNIDWSITAKPADVDNSNNVISESTTVISEDSSQHVISETQNTQGGEKIGESTETIINEVKVDDQGKITETTDTNTNTDTNTSNTDNGGVQGVTEEEVGDNVVTPDIGGGEIVDSETETENHEVNPDLGGGEIVNGENTNTPTNTFSTFALGADETYTAPMNDSYLQNSQLAANDPSFEMTSNEDGTYSVTNTGDTDIDVAAQQRSEENNVIDNSDIADELAALGAELGLDLSIENTNDGPTR